MGTSSFNYSFDETSYYRQQDIDDCLQEGDYEEAKRIIQEGRELGEKVDFMQVVKIAKNIGNTKEAQELAKLVLTHTKSMAPYLGAAEAMAECELKNSGQYEKAAGVLDYWLDRWEKNDRTGKKERDWKNTPLVYKQRKAFMRAKYAPYYSQSSAIKWEAMQLGVDRKDENTIKNYKRLMKDLIVDYHGIDTKAEIRVREHALKVLPEEVTPRDYFNLAICYSNIPEQGAFDKMLEYFNKINMQELEASNPSLAAAVNQFKKTYIEGQQLTPEEFLKMYFLNQQDISTLKIDGKAPIQTTGGRGSGGPRPGKPTTARFFSSEKCQFYQTKFLPECTKTYAEASQDGAFAQYYAFDFKEANVRIFEVLTTNKDDAKNNAIYITPIDYVPPIAQHQADGSFLTAKQVLRAARNMGDPVVVMNHTENLYDRLLKFQDEIRAKGVRQALLDYNAAHCNIGNTNSSAGSAASVPQTAATPAKATVIQTDELVDKIEELHKVMRDRRELQEEISAIKKAMAVEQDAAKRAEMEENLSAGQELVDGTTEDIAKITGRSNQEIEKRLPPKDEGRGE